MTDDAGATFVIVRSTAVLAGTAWLAAATASAQDFDGADLFVRDRGVGVRERSHPAYEAAGLPLGAITLLPRIWIETEYTDNVFAAEHQAQDDVVWRLRPELTLKAEGARHQAQAYARGGISRNLAFGSENFQDWRLGGDGRITVAPGTRLAAGAQVSHGVEARTASGAAASKRPIRFDAAEAHVEAARTTGRLRLSGRTEVRRIEYADGRDAHGAVLPQANRDRTVASLGTRIDYAISPATAVFGQIAGNVRDYRDAHAGAPTRSSSGQEALAGVNFELSGLSRGEVAAGYIRQSFDDAAYADLSGFTGQARLEWFPTQLTTVTAALSRTVEDAGVPGAAGSLRTEVGAGLDHELLRNLILTARAAYAEDAYNGVDRMDRRFSLTLTGTYRLNRTVGVAAALARIDQSSSGSLRGPAYDVTRASLSVSTQF